MQLIDQRGAQRSAALRSSARQPSNTGWWSAKSLPGRAGRGSIFGPAVYRASGEPTARPDRTPTHPGGPVERPSDRGIGSGCARQPVAVPTRTNPQEHRRPTRSPPCQLPPQIEAVGDGAVHPGSTAGCHPVGGVADEESVTDAESLGDRGGETEVVRCDNADRQIRDTGAPIGSGRAADRLRPVAPPPRSAPS